MRTSEGVERLIHRTAVGALLAFDATIVFAILAINVSYYTYDPRSLIVREPLLIWLPFALAALATILLTLAAGLGGAVGAIRGRRGWWATSFPILMALAVILPLLLPVSRDSLEQYVLIAAVGLLYPVLPVLALLFIGRRTSIRLLAATSCVAYGILIVCILLTYAFPRFGLDPNKTVFIYFPPQFSVAIMMLVVAPLFSMAGGIACAIDGRLIGRTWWSNTFLLALGAGLLAPLLIAGQNHYPPLVSTSPSVETLLGIIGGASYLALPVMALVYLRRRPANSRWSRCP